MGFVSTSAKQRKYQSISQILIAILAIYDLRNGQILKTAFGDINAILIFLWAWSLFSLLGMIGISIMLKPFYKAGGKVWTEGGREQFAHAGGFTISFYGTMFIEIMTIIIYPYIRKFYGLVILNNGISVTIFSSVLSIIFCWVSAYFIFGKINK